VRLNKEASPGPTDYSPSPYSTRRSIPKYLFGKRTEGKPVKTLRK